MFTLKEIKEKLQKPFNRGRGSSDWLSVYVYSPLARPIIKLLLGTSVTANQVTSTMVIAGVLGCFLLALGKYWLGIIGIALIQLHILLDHVDGPIARAKNTASLKGIYIERIGHDLVFTLFFFSIALGSINMAIGIVPMLVLGFFASFGYFFYKHTRRVKIYCYIVENWKKGRKDVTVPEKDFSVHQLVQPGLLRGIYRKTQIIWEPIFFINFATVLAIADAIYIIPIFYGLTYPVQFILSYVYQASLKKDWVDEWLNRG